jgi:hypothetical protein
LGKGAGKAGEMVPMERGWCFEFVVGRTFKPTFAEGKKERMKVIIGYISGFMPKRHWRHKVLNWSDKKYTILVRPPLVRR